MIHLYTSHNYDRPTSFSYEPPKDSFKLLCTKEWYLETEYVAKGPYSAKRPKSVTSVRKHVTCPKCLDTLLHQAIAEVDQMKAAYLRNSGSPYEIGKNIGKELASVPETQGKSRDLDGV